MSMSKWVLCVVILTVPACARVRIRKVPTPSQYVVWTDEMQRRADAMEGFRFYLPRPFVNVHETFPIYSEVFFAHGEVSADGKFVVLRDVQSPVGKKYFGDNALSGKISKRSIHRPSLENIKAQNETQESPEGDNKAASGGSEASPAPKPRPRTGLNRRRVTNDNDAYAYQPMRGSFDIAYLPDFEEQYVVDSYAGLGNTEFKLNLGQGWSLQGFDGLSDNSELNRRIFDVIDASIEAAKAAAFAAAGVPPVPALPGSSSLIQPQAGLEVEDGGVPGSPVTLKVVVVHYAARGLYPVLKPRELQPRLDADGEYFLCLDLFQWCPLATPATVLDSDALVAADSLGADTDAYTVPRYPYQYISFNTFRLLSVTLVEPGDSASVDPIHPTGTRRATDRPDNPSDATRYAGGAGAGAGAPNTRLDAEDGAKADLADALRAELTVGIELSGNGGTQRFKLFSGPVWVANRKVFRVEFQPLGDLSDSEGEEDRVIRSLTKRLVDIASDSQSGLPSRFQAAGLGDPSDEKFDVTLAPPADSDPDPGPNPNGPTPVEDESQ